MSKSSIGNGKVIYDCILNVLLRESLVTAHNKQMLGDMFVADTTIHFR